MAEKPKLALSHSRLSDFNQCPRKFKLKYIDKAKNMLIDDNQKSIHLVRGQNVHKALEKYAILKIAGNTNIPESSIAEVESTKPYIDKMIAEYESVLPESQIAIDSDYNQVDWFSPLANWRAIFDLVSVSKPKSEAVIDDYKTGKLTDYDAGPSGFGQLHLSAMIALSLMPNIEVVRVNYLYVDHRKKIPSEFKQSSLPDLKIHFESEHRKVNAEVNFEPTKNKFCNYCDATKAQCPYSNKIQTTTMSELG